MLYFTQLSTISFGKRIVIDGEKVWASNDADAIKTAHQLGMTTRMGWKFEGVRKAAC